MVSRRFSPPRVLRASLLPRWAMPNPLEQLVATITPFRFWTDSCISSNWP
jgi:hypothetical protein